MLDQRLHLLVREIHGRGFNVSVSRGSKSKNPTSKIGQIVIGIAGARLSPARGQEADRAAKWGGRPPFRVLA